jgi:hypothetical protein
VRVGAVDGLGEARPVEQDLVVALARFLLADKVERVAQRRDVG